jgi:hypothetical protein
LPATFTLDACRLGGMTQLEESELTTGRGTALSGHRGYAKPKIGLWQAHAHRLANEPGTKFLNTGRTGFQNDGTADDAAIA